MPLDTGTTAIIGTAIGIVIKTIGDYAVARLATKEANAQVVTVTTSSDSQTKMIFDQQIATINDLRAENREMNRLRKEEETSRRDADTSKRECELEIIRLRQQFYDYGIIKANLIEHQAERELLSRELSAIHSIRKLNGQRWYDKPGSLEQLVLTLSQVDFKES